MTHDKDRVFLYAGSKGRLLEMDIKPMIICAADAENEQFYGVHGISPRQILAGEVSTPSGASDLLYNTLNALYQRSPHLNGLPGPGKRPGDCRVKALVTVRA